MSHEFHRGDIVEWNTSKGTTRGHVIKRLTEDCTIEDYDVKASEDNPKYLVETCESEKRAAHTPGALTMVASSDIG